MATSAQDEGKSLVAQAIDAVKAHIRDKSLRVGDALPGEG
jgi:DNA-binding FadR family transcriptional regulator